MGHVVLFGLYRHDTFVSRVSMPFLIRINTSSVRRPAVGHIIISLPVSDLTDGGEFSVTSTQKALEVARRSTSYISHHKLRLTCLRLYIYRLDR